MAIRVSAGGVDTSAFARITDVSEDAAVLEAHARDASRAVPEGLPALVITPKSTEEVSRVLQEANRQRVPVVTRGAGTGMSGGAVALPGCIVLSMTEFTDARIDPRTRTAEVGAGVITGDLDRAAGEHGLMFGPDPVSKDTSTVGGNIATNAGGPRCLSFGVTADAVQQLEVVLADGSVVHTGSATIKNSTGYDLTRLFVGSEGTLGVITRAVVRLHEAIPDERVTFAISHPELAAVGDIIQVIVQRSVKPVSLELMDANTLELVSQFYTDIEFPPGQSMVVGEYAGADADAHLMRIRTICTDFGASVLVGKAAEDILLTRLRVNPALNQAGLAASCDVVVPLDRLAEMLMEIEAISEAHGMRVNTFAHAGDGNLHPAVAVEPGNDAAMEATERVLNALTERALELGGMVSGEHGIGSLKVHHIPDQFDAATHALMKRIKLSLDPNDILNPGRAI